jgi:hypothetical protein
MDTMESIIKGIFTIIGWLLGAFLVLAFFSAIMYIGVFALLWKVAGF